MTQDTAKPKVNTIGLGQDFTVNKVERSLELAGRQLVGELYDTGAFTIDFIDGEKLIWSGRLGNIDGVNVAETYEAQKAADGLFLIAFQNAADALESTAILADWHSGEIVLIRNRVGPKQPGVPAVAQTIRHGRISTQPWIGPRIEHTTELFGRRAMWVYSENDVYEHIYLNATRYAWHCLKGDEYPEADIDPCAMYKVRDNIYLLTFSEKVMTMAAGMLLDFGALRSYCAAIGRDRSTEELSHFTFGAFGRVLSQTDYPDPLVA